MFQLGQRAYEKGLYDKSVELLEAALTNIPAASHLGGEVSMSGTFFLVCYFSFVFLFRHLERRFIVFEMVDWKVICKRSYPINGLTLASKRQCMPFCFTPGVLFAILEGGGVRFELSTYGL